MSSVVFTDSSFNLADISSTSNPISISIRSAGRNWSYSPTAQISHVHFTAPITVLLLVFLLGICGAGYTVFARKRQK